MQIAIAIRTIGQDVCWVAASRGGRVWLRPIKTAQDAQWVLDHVTAAVRRAAPPSRRVTAADEKNRNKPKLYNHKGFKDSHGKEGKVYDASDEYKDLRKQLEAIGFEEVMQRDDESAEWVFENKIPIHPYDRLYG